MDVEGYDRLIGAVTRAIRRSVPAGARVAVVSRGDERLLDIEGVEGWHFPRRADGVHAGHHPADGAAAVRHLESVIDEGAGYFVLPATEMWWLDHYGELRDYLDAYGTVLVSDPESCTVVQLSSPRSVDASVVDVAAEESWSARPADGRDRSWRDLVPPEVVDDLPLLFHRAYYERRSGATFRDDDAALLDYLTAGAARGFSPHPLVDDAWYLAQCPAARTAGVVPVVHFLLSGGRRNEIGGYFDTEHYLRQTDLSPTENPLVHYLRAGRDATARPNPIFFPRFYAANAPGFRECDLDPLTHYLLEGVPRSVPASPVQRAMQRQVLPTAPHGLLRGRWERATALLVTDGVGPTAELVVGTAARLRELHCECLVVAARRFDVGESLQSDTGPPQVVFLEDYEVDCDVLRPSSTRLFLRSLMGAVSFAVVDVPALVPVLTREAVRTVLLGDAAGSASVEELGIAVAAAERVLVSGPSVVDRLTGRLGHRPVNAVVRPRRATGTSSRGRRLGPDDVIEVLATHLPAARAAMEAPQVQAERPRVVIPCSDWNVSGVNASLHALGTELLSQGWDVELLFTRDRRYVEESAGTPENLPSLPYRFLPRRRLGVEGMWQALLADIEDRAPCVVFMAYDFLANSAVPALTDRVGVVAWVQSDDGDYYEQAYRLGRYCNAIVCVSSHIRDELITLNPAFAPGAHVIHNASVWESDVATKKTRSEDRVRIVYTGRLVQYQKRVLDFVALAEALDRQGTPYSITLIGDFLPGQDLRQTFTARAREHLADGRIVLAGRRTRSEILAELGQHDFFALLSDFEGLPLSLVEAMARGCVPVVAEMDSGIPEVVTCGENGLVVEGRDYDLWAARVRKTWEDPATYRRLSRNARRTVRGRFTVERAARQFDELFRTILEQISANKYERPPSLHWGSGRGAFGDVLPPPSMHRTINVKGLS